jgi:hypothetical protein
MRLVILIIFDFSCLLNNSVCIFIALVLFQSFSDIEYILLI